jgi:hypothetical protein
MDDNEEFPSLSARPVRLAIGGWVGITGGGLIDFTHVKELKDRFWTLKRPVLLRAKQWTVKHIVLNERMASYSQTYRSRSLISHMPICQGAA